MNILVLAYLGACLLLFFFQDFLLYHPTRVPKARQKSLKTYEVRGTTINLSERSRNSPDALIYFGGNGEDVSASLSTFAWSFRSRAIYMVHYRGYGGSRGRPQQDDILADAEAIFDIIQKRHKNILVVGRSLGSGVAVHLAANRDVERLVLVTPYDSVLEVAKSRFPIFPISWMLRDKYESWRLAPNISAPTLLLVAEHDRVIPFKRSQNLYAHFKRGVARMVVIEGTGHNSIANSSSYMRSMGDGN